ncbi:FG-GAP repeat protein [Streptomyces sp. NBC_00510]
MRKFRLTAVASASFLLLAGVGTLAAPTAQAKVPGGARAADRNCDFNGDGYEDVLLGAPGATVSGMKGAGYVTVQYGSSRGIGTARSKVFSQSTAGVPGAAETGDGFGTAVASGDLNADGYDDAAIGIPREDVGSAPDAGGVLVLWGSAKGLAGANSMWMQDKPYARAAGARFGYVLAAGRFTAQTPADQLIILAGKTGVGRYMFPYVRGAQRSAGAPRAVLQPMPAGAVRASDPAGQTRQVEPKSATTGDYDHNGFADLVLSGPGKDEDPGQSWAQYWPGGETEMLPGRDLRGGPVAATGDINGDGYDDLVTGEPYSPNDGADSTTGGRIGVYYGSADGPVGVGGVGKDPKWWTQNSPGVPGSSERGDGWGTDISVADTNGDGRADVAIGAAGEDVGAVVDAGAVWILRGSAAGLTATGAKSWSQNSSGIPGTAEKGDRWGGQVRLADPDRDKRSGLLASAPGENTDDGAVWVLATGSGGVSASGSWTYGGGSLGASSVDARFGAAIDE